MFELRGKYGSAKVFTDNCDNETVSQITTLLNQSFTKDIRIRIMPDCLPKFTEVLTNNGFVPINKLTQNDKVANYDKNTGMISWKYPKQIIKRAMRKNEQMYEFYVKQNNFSFYATEKHRMLTKNGVVLAKDIPEITSLSDYIFFGNGLAENIITKYSNLELQLICWIVGDGSICDNGCGTKRIKFSFCKQRKFDRITSLLTEYGAEYHCHIEKRGDMAITVNAKSSAQLINLLDNNKKEFPIDFISLDERQALVVKEEIIQIDGDYNAYIHNNGYRYSSTNRHNIDILQALFCLNKNLVSMKTQRRNHPAHNDLYYMNVIDAQRLTYSRSGLHHNKVYKSKLDYSDDVYCIECDTSFFIIRQNGLVTITGNCHAGKGCVVGTTMTLTNKVVPNLVGVDIGCGMLATRLEEDSVDLTLLDTVINQYVPSGFSIHDTAVSSFAGLDKILCPINKENAEKSIGSLGGGNHFIELDRDKDGHLWLVIHCGSRHLGIEVCNHYQKEGYLILKNNRNREKITAVIEELKAAGRQKEIEQAIKAVSAQNPVVPEELAYVEGDLFEQYINDMHLTQQYAKKNRQTIADIITRKMNLHPVEVFDTIHNYIDPDNMILRKGSISAQKGERVIIPMNMRDGSLICIGKGNPDWNYSAPHGAGRIMSRSQAKDNVDMDEFKDAMKDIFSTSVCQSTIDEAPQVYKSMAEIMDNIQDTVDIIDVIKPVYNFKAH